MKRVESRAGPYALPLAIRGHGTLYRRRGLWVRSPTTAGRDGAAREGGRTSAADTAGGNSSRCGRTRLQHATVTYLPTSTRPMARPVSPLIFPGPFLVGAMRPAAPFERYFGGGGVVCRIV